MKRWLFLAALLWFAVSVALAESPADYAFPEHSPVLMQKFAKYSREAIAKVKKGMTRKDLLHDFLPKKGTMFSEVETYYYGPTLSDTESGTVFFDVVFRPAAMSDAVFNKSFGKEKQLRGAGLWPEADARDVIVAVSKPYYGPQLYDFVLEVSALPPAVREHLRGVKVGMTRRELLQTFDPSVGIIHPPVEPHLLRGTKDAAQPITVDIAFKPAAMDDRTYADADLRAEWFQHHSWLAGDDLDDTLMDLSKPYDGRIPGDEKVIDIHKMSAEARQTLKNLKVGVTRKQVMEMFGRAGGAYNPFKRALHNLPEKLMEGIPLEPGEWISVEIDFARAGNPSAPPDFIDYFRRFHAFPVEKEDDVVTGFSRAFVSPRGLYLD